MTRRSMEMLLAAAVLVALPGCPRNTNPPPQTTMSEIGTRTWSLVELNGRPAGTGAGGQPATLQLAADQASGFAGCNRFSSTYTLSGTALRFTGPVSTRMACAAGMELEQAYLSVITATRAYRVTDSTLELLGDGGTVLARFTARSGGA